VNLGASVVVIRARTMSEVLDLTFRLLMSFFGDYARLAAVVLLPCVALCEAFHEGLDVSWPWVWPMAFLLAVFLEGPFTVLTSRLLFGERLGVRGALGLYWSRFGTHLGASLLTLFFQALGACVVIGPLFIGPRCLFVDEAVLLENATPRVAHERSRRLTMESATSGLGIMFTILVVRAASIGFFEILGDGLVSELLQLGHPFGTLQHDHGSLYALIGLFAATPVVAVMRFLQYIDIRTRADGWDIQVRFMDLVAKDALVAR